MTGFRDDVSPGRIRPGLTGIPRQRRPRPAPRPAGYRAGVIYAWLIYEVDPATGLLLPPDPVTGVRPMRLDYVGQTIRLLDVRAEEHLEDKPWADIVVGVRPVVVEQGEWTKAERDAREVAAIRRLRPRYNYRDNLDNAERIEIWRQREHRAARDAAAGRQPWRPPAGREPARVGPLPVADDTTPLTLVWGWTCAAARFVCRLPGWVHVTLAVATGWLAAAWGLIVILHRWGWPEDLARIAAPVAVTALAAAVFGGGRKPRRRKRRRRDRP